MTADAAAWTNTRSTRRKLTKTAFFGLLVIFLLAFGAIFAPWISPNDPYYGDLGVSLSGPMAGHPLGFDGAGRDFLARLLYGGRISLLGPLIVVLLSALIGVPLGIAAGYAGGWVD